MTDYNSSNTPQLATINQFIKRNPFMTHGGVRHLIFHADSNGFSRCIRRIGRRVYIHEGEFHRWVEESQTGAHHARM